MATPPNPLRPSPLSFGSPSRASPFRRPNSPLTHSPSTVRNNNNNGASTPTQSSPLKNSTPSALSPEKTQSPFRRSTIAPAEDGGVAPWLTTRGTSNTPEAPLSPTRKVSGSTVRPLNVSRSSTPRELPTPTPTAAPMNASSRNVPSYTHVLAVGNGDNLSRVPPPLLHSLRESFSVLDRSNSGTVTSADVTETLSSLGLDEQSAAYLPPGSSSINLSTYLNTLSSLIAPLSQPSELLAAFEAFDDDDSGQIDLEELKDALMHTAPEKGERRITEREFESVVGDFSGRRAFAKGGLGGKTKRGDVFRYQEFVGGITGGSEVKGNGMATRE